MAQLVMGEIAYYEEKEWLFRADFGVMNIESKSQFIRQGASSFDKDMLMKRFLIKKWNDDENTKTKHTISFTHAHLEVIFAQR